MQIPEQTAALTWCAAALQAAIPFDDMESSIRLFDTGESKTVNEILDLANAALATTKATAPVAAPSTRRTHHRDGAPLPTREHRSDPGLGDDIPCTKCGSALDTGLECTECGYDMAPEINPRPVEAIGEPVAVISERALKKLADGTARCVHAYSKVVDEDDVKLYRGTPATPSSQDAPRAVPAGLSDAQREALIDMVNEQHMTAVYHCLRVWDAWSVGTMSEDDFQPANESDMAAEIVDAILAALAASAPGAPDLAQPQPGTGSGS